MRARFSVARVWDVLALLAIGFVLWKVFVAPRSFTAAAQARSAPLATFARLDGPPFAVAQARGHVTFLSFFASWCDPCKQELPVVEAWAKDHPSAVVVPVDVGEPRVAVAAFARRYHLAGVALDPGARAQALFAVHGFPTIVVIDPDGRIRATWEGLNPAVAMAMTNAGNQLAR